MCQASDDETGEGSSPSALQSGGGAEAVNLGMERLRRAPDNTKITVEELLALALDDVRKGEYNATKAIIVIVDEISDDGSSSVESYRCGMNRAEEMGWLEAAKQHCWRRWMKS